MKRTLSLILTLCLVVSALFAFASAEDDVPTAKVIYGTPYIDGEKDASWDDAQINKLSIVFYDDEITTPSTCRFRAMYDENYLYFYVEVSDTTMSDLEWELNSTNKWYNRDGVAFCFAPNGSREVTTTQVAPSFWYIIRAFGSVANYNSVDPKIFITEKADFDKANANDFTLLPAEERMYAITYEKDASGNYIGYNIECKVNLKARYEEFKSEAGTKVGFEMNLNDNNYLLMSAIRNYGLVWADATVVSYKDDSLKGILEYCAKGETFVNTEEEVTTATPTTEEQTTTAPEVTTAPETTTAAEITTAEVTTAAATTAEVTTEAPATTTEAAKSSSCGSFAAAGVALIAILGSAIVFKKH